MQIKFAYKNLILKKKKKKKDSIERNRIGENDQT